MTPELHDEHRSGGLLSRETLRKATALLVVLADAEAAAREKTHA